MAEARLISGSHPGLTGALRGTTLAMMEMEIAKEKAAGRKELKERNFMTGAMR